MLPLAAGMWDTWNNAPLNAPADSHHNNTLADRAGTELCPGLVPASAGTRAYAHGLQHQLGAVAVELHKATIPVLDDLARLPFKPDLIHASTIWTP